MVGGNAGFGSIQVNDVDPLRACVLELLCLRERVFVIYGDVVISALSEPDALASDEIYRGKYYHLAVLLANFERI